MDQVLSAFGAAGILLAFWALQTKRMSADQPRYQLLNLVGAGLLAAASVMSEKWAFVVLNTVWSLVALWALLPRDRGLQCLPEQSDFPTRRSRRRPWPRQRSSPNRKPSRD